MPPKSIVKKVDGVPKKALEKYVREEVRVYKAKEKEEIIQAKVELMNSPLTDEERHEHQVRKSRIVDGFQQIYATSLSVWQDLQWINENRTYREEYETFNDFCKEALGKDNSQIYRYLKDAKFKEQLLLTAADDQERMSIMSMKESNTRFIRTLPEDVQTAFWKVAYSIGRVTLPHKEDGSIEPTTAYLESVGEGVTELNERGGITVNGEFIPVNAIQEAAESVGVDESTAKALLLGVGISEEYYESLKRQEQHIKEKSMKADFTVVRGTIEHRVDSNGSDYPALKDSKGNYVDLHDLLLSFNNRFVTLSLKSPIRE